MIGPDRLAGIRALPFAVTLSFAVCIGLFPPHALGALSPFIIPELGVSRALYGSLGTAAFGAAALLSPVAGMFVDRMGARTALMSLFAVATVALTAFGLAHAYWMLLSAVCLAGAATALANPSATSMVLQAAPPARRARFLGIAQTGPPLAALIAGVLLPVGAAELGWHASVVLVAAAAMVGALSTYLFLPGREHSREHSREHGTVPSPRHDAGRTRRALAPNRRDWTLGAYAFLMNIAVVPVTVYVPLYAFQELDWTQNHAALLTGLLGVSSLVGRLVWSSGAAASGRTLSTRLTLLPIVAAAGMTLILAAAPMESAWMLWIGVGAFGGSALAWTVLTMLAVMVQSSKAKERAGRSAGTVMLLGFFGGAVGPLLFGSVVDAAGSYTPAWTLALLALGLNVAVARTIGLASTAS